MADINKIKQLQQLATEHPQLVNLDSWVSEAGEGFQPYNKLTKYIGLTLDELKARQIRACVGGWAVLFDLMEGGEVYNKTEDGRYSKTAASILGISQMKMQEIAYSPMHLGAKNINHAEAMIELLDGLLEQS